jgi:hypothetical protein
MMRDNVVVNYVDIMNVVLVAGVKTGCRGAVASEGRTPFIFLLIMILMFIGEIDSTEIQILMIFACHDEVSFTF